jgi:transcriptional regulator with XRE-family HTH domain
VLYWIFLAIRDIIMHVIFETPKEISQRIAAQARAKRLSLNLTQKSLAERSGVSLSVLKKFERTGEISLLSLLKLAMPLDALESFAKLFQMDKMQNFSSLDEILNAKERKRGRE